MISYPNGKKEIKKEKFIPKNLGMDFERDIDITNQYYLDNNIAVVYKKPTPIQIVDVDYPSRNKAKITKAFFIKPSTTDYNGIYLGKYIDFDAKITSSKTSIPLSNIHKHQIDHLTNISNHGGLGFLLVYWRYYDEYYLIKIEDLNNIIKRSNKKSISYTDFKNVSFTIRKGYIPRIYYLETVVVAYNLDNSSF